MLELPRRKTNAVYRALLFLPSLVSVVVAGTVFRLMFAYSPRAVVNAVIVLFGGGPSTGSSAARPRRCSSWS